MFLKPQTKVDFRFENLYFYCISPRNISDKVTITKNVFTTRSNIFYDIERETKFFYCRP